jgi:hypothetical protein
VGSNSASESSAIDDERGVNATLDCEEIDGGGRLVLRLLAGFGGWFAMMDLAIGCRVRRIEL